MDNHALDEENKLSTNLPKEYRAENAEVVEKRMTKSLTKIAKQQEKNGGGNVLVVSSGMSVNIFLNGQKFPEYKGEGIKNDAVTELTYKGGKFKLASEIGSLKYFNDGKKASK
jgi:broad specificity phosphatase PhoE